MWTILRNQLLLLRREPGTLVLMILLTVLFSIALGSQAHSKVTVYTFYNETAVTASEADQWVEILNESESFEFKLTDQQSAQHRVTDGKSDYALELLADDYRIVAAVNNASIQTLNQYVRTVYEQELAIRAASEGAGNQDDFRKQLENRLQDPVMSVDASTVNVQQDFKYDPQIQSLFGFALFFVMYTIVFAINRVLEEKKTGVWDRVKLSPVSKTSMYSGHLVNSFLVGYLQIVIVFVLFRFAFQFPIGDQFLTILIISAIYTFAIVALGMLLVGFLQTPQQMNALIPIVAVSSAMLGGAYWPIEIVSNPVLIALSKIVPITYGMEALKGVVYYGHGWAELMQPVSIMILFGVVCMGIGINLIERRGR